MQTQPRTLRTFTAYVEWDAETRLYVGTVPGVTGAHTQGATLDELQRNLRDVLELCIEQSLDLDDVPRFVGIQQVEANRDAPHCPAQPGEGKPTSVRAADTARPRPVAGDVARDRGRLARLHAGGHERRGTGPDTLARARGGSITE